LLLAFDRLCPTLFTQLIVSALALQSKSDTSTLISLAGNMVLYEICSLIGAMTVAPYKYMWWVASLIFLGLVFMVLMQRLNNPEGYGGESLQGLTYLIVCCFCVYPIIWIIGSEGTAALGLSQQTGLLCITDVVAKLGFGFYLLSNIEDESGSAPLNQSSQQYV
jgi:bacteriorhodopsin